MSGKAICRAAAEEVEKALRGGDAAALQRLQLRRAQAPAAAARRKSKGGSSSRTMRVVLEGVLSSGANSRKRESVKVLGNHIGDVSVRDGDSRQTARAAGRRCSKRAVGNEGNILRNDVAPSDQWGSVEAHRHHREPHALADSSRGAEAGRRLAVNGGEQTERLRGVASVDGSAAEGNVCVNNEARQQRIERGEGRSAYIGGVSADNQRVGKKS